MTLGPESSRLLARAAKAAPASPRLLLFRGISLAQHTDDVGRDPVEGPSCFNKPWTACQRQCGVARPALGRADALTWLGLAKQKAGDAEGARTAWQQALAIEPGFAWVKFALLPSLGQKAPKQ